YRRQGQKVCFNVAKFDAVAADLDLRIHATLKKKQIITKPALVAGSISAPTRMLKESRCRKIGTSEVARANIWPHNHNFASLVGWKIFPRSMQNKNIGPGHRTAHWQGRIFFQN